MCTAQKRCKIDLWCILKSNGNAGSIITIFDHLPSTLTQNGGGVGSNCGRGHSITLELRPTGGRERVSFCIARRISSVFHILGTLRFASSYSLWAFLFERCWKSGRIKAHGSKMKPDTFFQFGLVWLLLISTGKCHPFLGQTPEGVLPYWHRSVSRRRRRS